VATRITVVYYNATGTVHALAEALAEGASSAGAEVRLRRVPELAERAAIDSSPQWAAHLDSVTATVPVAELHDLEWADGIALRTPTRFGTPSAQLKRFLDQTGGLWARGALADKAATSFTAASNRHGGNEATLLSLNNVFYHWARSSSRPVTPTRSSTQPAATPTARRFRPVQARDPTAQLSQQPSSKGADL